MGQRGPAPGAGGRPNKPTEQHKKQGTYRKDRHASGSKTAGQGLEPSDSAPLESTPAEIAAEVLRKGAYWLGETDAPTVAMLRETLEERAQLREAVLNANDPSQVDPKIRSGLRDLDREVIHLLSVLGLDPSSRSKLGLAEVKAKSKMEKLQDRNNKN